MASPISSILKLSLTLAVCVACTVALPPNVFARRGLRQETRQVLPMDCSPRPDGTTPHGCADTVAGNAINYETPGERGGVLELAEGFDSGVTVVEDERAGTYLIRVPQYQPLHRRGCPYLFVFVAELGMCVRENSLRQLPFKYPSLAARLF